MISIEMFRMTAFHMKTTRKKDALGPLQLPRVDGLLL